MRRFIRLCGKVKYLGLLGLPGLFLKYRLFDILWLFWLFGLVEIFYNFPVFLQSLRQFWGMIYVPLHYGSHFPNKRNYRCKVQYSLPFAGAWTVVNGGVDKESSHSWGIPAQRYAYDFLILNDDGKSFMGDVTNPAAYHCYNREILSPAEGEIIEVGACFPESPILGNGRVDCSAHDLRGNYVLIRHGDHEYSLLAHLKPGSISVKTGDVVQRGQYIARCGNSGNSSEPHLHFQLQNGISFYTSAGLPVEFEEISAKPALNYSAYDPRPVPLADGLQEKYITRGYNVLNL